MKVNNFDILREMSARNGKIMLLPLDNIKGMQKTKRGTEITIGGPDEILMGLMAQQYIGGMLLADKDEYAAVKATLETPEAPVKVDVEGLACACYLAMFPDDGEYRAPWSQCSTHVTDSWKRVAQAAYNYTRPVLNEAEWSVVLEALDFRWRSVSYGNCIGHDEVEETNNLVKTFQAVAAKIKARGK